MPNKLTKRESKEWKSLSGKSKRHKIPIKRIKGTSNVRFSKKVYAQLGTGRASTIMNARIKLKKKYGRKY